MNDVRIYDKKMKLKRTIPAKALSQRYWDQFKLHFTTRGPSLSGKTEALEKAFREKYGIKTRQKEFKAYPEKPEKKEQQGS